MTSNWLGRSKAKKILWNARRSAQAYKWTKDWPAMLFNVSKYESIHFGSDNPKRQSVFGIKQNDSTSCGRKRHWCCHPGFTRSQLTGCESSKHSHKITGTDHKQHHQQSLVSQVYHTRRDWNKQDEKKLTFLKSFVIWMAMTTFKLKKFSHWDGWMRELNAFLPRQGLIGRQVPR